MALTNAQRQRRYRQRLKARASGDALGEQARLAVDRAVEALWGFRQRPGPGGIDWAAIDGCATIEAYRAELASAPGNLISTARAFLPDWEGVSDEERAVLSALIEAADALALRGG